MKKASSEEEEVNVVTMATLLQRPRVSNGLGREVRMHILRTKPLSGVDELPVPKNGVGVGEDRWDAELVAHGDPRNGNGSWDRI